MGLSKIKRSCLYEEIVEELLAYIRSEDIKPGERFPSERQLALTLDVSRNVLREAFRVLENKGIVRCKAGGGRYLRDFTDLNIFHAPAENLFLHLEKAVLLDVVEARETIEIEIAKKAAQRAEEEDIERLSSLITELEQAPDEISQHSDLDLDFHLAVAKATRNHIFHDLLELQINLLKNISQKNFLGPEGRRALCHEHRNILKAIKDRDSKGSARAMAYHLQSLREVIQAIKL